MPLTLAVAQPRCVPGDTRANGRWHADAVAAAGARVVVFPELSLTGYELDVDLVGPGDAGLAAVVEACQATGTMALVGAPVPGPDGQAYIATLAVSPDGVAVLYRKQWIGGDEAGRFSPGDEPAVTEVDGWRIGIGICRDTGIAAHVERMAALDIDRLRGRPDPPSRRAGWAGAPRGLDRGTLPGVRRLLQFRRPDRGRIPPHGRIVGDLVTGRGRSRASRDNAR